MKMSDHQVRLLAEAGELVTAARDLAATASEQAERLHANVLEFRILEFKRQLILGRILRTLDRAAAQSAAMPSAERKEAEDVPAEVPASTTIH
jgi:hypothetical protein